MRELIKELAWYVAQFLFAVCIGIAVFRYRLWDIDLVINRVLVYGSLTLLTMAVYLATVLALGSLFRAFGSPAVFFVATARGAFANGPSTGNGRRAPGSGQTERLKTWPGRSFMRL